MSDAAALYLAALSAPDDEEALAALASVLSDDVRAGGMFGYGTTKDEVLKSTASPPYPLLASARWAEPAVDGDVTSIEGTFPPGLPVAGVTITVRERDGKLIELAQELVQAPPTDPTPLVVDEQVAALINAALDNKTPVIAAYVDADGVPHVSPRGTVQSWSDTALAMWARDPKGGMLRAIPVNPSVSLFYRDGAARAQYEMVGRMRVTEDADERQRVFDGSPLIERNFDPMMRGKAIIVDLDSLVGSGPSGRVNMRRGA